MKRSESSMRSQLSTVPQRESITRRALLVALSLACGGCQTFGPELKRVFAWDPSGGAKLTMLPDNDGPLGGSAAALRCIENAARFAAEGAYAAASTAVQRGESANLAAISAGAAVAFSASLAANSPPTMPTHPDTGPQIAAAIASGLTRAATAAGRPSVALTADAEAARAAYTADTVAIAVAAGVTEAARTFGYATTDGAPMAAAVKFVVARAEAAAATARASAADAAFIAKVSADVAANPDKAGDIVASAIGQRRDLLSAIVAAAVGAAPTAVEKIVEKAVFTAPGQGPAIVQAAITAAPNISAAAISHAASKAQVVSTAAGQPAGVATSVATVSSAGAGAGGRISGRLPLNEDEFKLVKVLYATDRKPVMDFATWKAEFYKKGSDHAYYGGEPEPERLLRYGRCIVSIPVAHLKAKLERPKIWQKEDSAKHIMIRGITELDRTSMLLEVAGLTEPANPGDSRKDAFIFIHGFNVKFNEAAMRAAQMSHDFGFLGAPLLFSWSSLGRALRHDDYTHDERTVLCGVQGLRKLIEDVKAEGKVRKLHLVAHSMGNRALVQLLKELRAEGKEKMFGEVVLAAADVAKTDFTCEDAEKILPLAERISLYVSADDRPLMLSEWDSKVARLGQGGRHRFVLPGIETIEATGADADWFSLKHSYPMNVLSVLEDLGALLVKQAAAGARGLAEATDGNGRYWKIAK